LSTAVVALGALALVTTGAPLVFSFGLLLSMLNGEATSAALNGFAVVPLHALADGQRERLAAFDSCRRWPASEWGRVE